MTNENLIKILFIEDLPSDADLAVLELRKEGIRFEYIRVDTRNEFIKALNEFRPDIIISDYMLPSYNGMRALTDAREFVPFIPFILCTGSMNEETAVECLKAGADDYIIKEHLTRLPFAVKEALERYRVSKEKRAAELLLVETEEKLQSIFTAAPVGIGLVVNRIFMEVNDTFCKMTGYSRKALIGKSSELIYATRKEYERDGTEKYRQIYEKSTGTVETRFKCKNGKILNILLSSAPLDIADLSKGVTFTAIDITERMQAQEELSESKQIIEDIINAIPVRVFWKDKNLVYLGCNKVFAMDSGFKDPKDIIGKDDYQMGWRAQAGLYRKDDQEVIESGRSKLLIEEAQTTPEGKNITLLTSKIPLLNIKGEITGVIGTYIDITDRKLFELELIKAKDKAEEGDRLKTAFLNNISHEIRTPMNAIVGFSELLGEPDVDTQTRKDYIEVIVQSSNHLLASITDIVDIANIEANLVKIEKNDININSVLKSLCKQFLPKVNEKRIQLTCETDIPESDAFIIADRTKLTQILINLINNAIKFTDHGDVKFGCTLSDKFLEFHVSDTGIGISEEYYNKIFDRFYQIQHTESRLYEGIGLGLPISKANVVLMGGKIWLTSEPGKGTSFYFTIPYEKQVVETPAVNEKRVSEDFAFPEEKTILVAEDIDSNFKLVEVFLSNVNAEIIRAANGKEAVEIFLANKNIDLILMDIKMPVMDGYTAVKLIRESNSTIPIIAQTAYIDDKERAFELGCSGFISKPFDKKGLLKVLQEFI